MSIDTFTHSLAPSQRRRQRRRPQRISHSCSCTILAISKSRYVPLHMRLGCGCDCRSRPNKLTLCWRVCVCVRVSAIRPLDLERQRHACCDPIEEEKKCNKQHTISVQTTTARDKPRECVRRLFSDNDADVINVGACVCKLAKYTHICLRANVLFEQQLTICRRRTRR